MNPTILLFTDHYPFGSGESFLEAEVERLAHSFKLVLISTSALATPRRQLDSSVQVLRFNPDHTPMGWWEKLQILGDFLTHRACIDELAAIIKTKKRVVKRISHALYAFGKSRRLYRYLQDEGLVDFNETTILYFYWMNYKPIYFALTCADHPKVKLISRVHGYDLYNERHPVQRHPFRQLVDQAMDSVFFVSDAGMDYYLKTFGITPSAKHQRLYLGTQRSHEVALKAKSEAFVVVSCANVIALKRLEWIIEALALVNLPQRSIHWIHFGDGPSMAAVQALAQEKLGSHPKIRYQFQGQVSHAALMDYYSTHVVDCFITLSSSEGLPVSIMEAMSFGIPVISTHVGGIAEMLPKDYPYLLDANVSYHDVALAIEALCGLSPTQRDEVSTTLKALWARLFNEETNTTTLMEKLRQR